MSVTSHLVRVAMLISVLALVAFALAVAGRAWPADAALQQSYVDDDRNAVDDGDPCVAHTVNYGGCYKSISSAINDLDVGAGEVDEIWVDDGNYNEAVFINKPLKLVSINGPSTTAISQSNSSYVVWVEADPVTFGGLGGSAGDGFTVLQEGAAPGYVLGINGPDIQDDTVTIQNSVFLGTDSLYAIFVANGIEGGHLVIRNNELQAQRCFEDATHITLGSDVEFTQNDCTGFTDTGVYIGSDGSGESVSDGSSLTISHNTLAGDSDAASYGVFIEGAAIRGSSMHVDSNDVSGFSRTAFHIESVSEDGVLTINDNAVTGDAALYGTYVATGIKYGSTADISRNTISGITADPIYVYEIAFDASATICNNTITGGNEGIVLEYPGDESSYEVCYNTIRDFTFDAIFTGLGSMENGSMNFIGNIIDSDAAEWGIYAEEIEGGAVLNVESNQIHLGDGLGGIYLYGPEEASTARIHNNVLDIPNTDAGIDVKQTSVAEGSSLIVTQNEIRGYDQDGLFVQNGADASTVLVQDNIFEGTGATSGINFAAPIGGGSIVSILNNCITNSVTGIITGNLLDDTSEMHINQNDLSGPATAIDGIASTKLVDGENNWFGSAAGPNGPNADVAGNVDADPWLNSAPNCSGATTTPGPTASPTQTTCGGCAVGGAVALSVGSGSQTPWAPLAVSLGGAVAVLTAGIWYCGRRRR